MDLNASPLLFTVLFLSGSGELLCQNPVKGDTSKLRIVFVDVFSDMPAGNESKDEAQPVTPQVILKPAVGPQKANPEVASLRSWILKFNPCLLVRGEAPFYLERRLNRTFTIEAAGGTTFEDYFKKVFTEGRRLNQKEPNTEKLSGVALKLALRYFPKHTAFSDVYLSPEIDYTTYRKQVSGIYPTGGGGYSEGKLMDQQKYTDFLLILGTQSSRERDEEIFLDWYLGAGLRTGNETNVVRYEQNVSMITTSHKTVTSPIITLGLKLGLGF